MSQSNLDNGTNRLSEYAIGLGVTGALVAVALYVSRGMGKGVQPASAVPETFALGQLGQAMVLVTILLVLATTTLAAIRHRYGSLIVR